MANYQFGTEESYEILVLLGMPKHPRMAYDAGNATISSARLMTTSSAQGVSINKVHPKEARDILTMHALRWAIEARDGASLNMLESVRVFYDPIDGGDSDPAAEATLNCGEGTEVRGKCDLLDTIVAAVLTAKGDALPKD